MSDTLQGREDEMSTERIDQIESKNADWCDDCHGYTHMPYCPSYGFVRGVSNQTVTSEHEPAARGGGEVIYFCNKCWNVYAEPAEHRTCNRTPQKFIAENRHQSLVAERRRFTRLVEAVKAMRTRHREAVKKSNSNDCGCDDCLLLQPILTAIEHHEQRSTSV